MDLQYRRLLQNQYKAVKDDFDAIQKTAKKLRDLILTDDNKLSSFDRIIKDRCCDLILLETIFTKYDETFNLRM